MKILIFVLLITSVLSQDNSTTPLVSTTAAGLPVTIDWQTTSTTTDNPTTTTTTESSTTIVTTEASSTTTFTTTESPSSTSAPPKPTPAFPPFPKNIGNWNVTYTKDSTDSCILLHGAIELTLTFNTIQDTPTEHIKKFDVPPEAVAHGQCGHEKQIINLTWASSDGHGKNMLSFEFILDSPTNGSVVATSNPPDKIVNATDYTLDTISMTFSTSQFEDGRYYPQDKENRTTITIPGLNLFQTNLNSSYKCDSFQNETTKELELRTQNFQFEAFRPKDYTTKGFSDVSSVCSMDPPLSHGTTVAIIVAVSLAILIILVLLGYFCGRKFWARRQGYQSLST